MGVRYNKRHRIVGERHQVKHRFSKRETKTTKHGERICESVQRTVREEGDENIDGRIGCRW